MASFSAEGPIVLGDKRGLSVYAGEADGGKGKKSGGVGETVDIIRQNQEVGANHTRYRAKFCQTTQIQRHRLQIKLDNTS